MTQQPGSAETGELSEEGLAWCKSTLAELVDHAYEMGYHEHGINPAIEMDRYVDWLRTENAQLQAQCDGMRKLIDDHNASCQSMCGVGDQEAVACKYRPYFESTGRRCPQCPTDWMIEAPSHGAALARGGKT